MAVGRAIWFLLIGLLIYDGSTTRAGITGGEVAVPIVSIYGRQAWTAGTFDVNTTPDGSELSLPDSNYPFSVFREEVKTVDGAGPAGERIIDSDDFGASGLTESGFGVSAGYFDARGLNDGNGLFYEIDAKFSSIAESQVGDFLYPLTAGTRNLTSHALLPLFQVRTALTEGKLYIDVNGDGGEVDTGVVISADDAWHHILVQIVPSSDNGDTMQDGIVKVWLDDVLIYNISNSWAWVRQASGSTEFFANYISFGRFGILPSTNAHIYYGTDDPLDLDIDESTPCCGDKVSPASGGGVGAALGENPFQALQPWTVACAGGGAVPSAADLTDPEDWSV